MPLFSNEDKVSLSLKGIPWYGHCIEFMTAYQSQQQQQKQHEGKIDGLFAQIVQD